MANAVVNITAKTTEESKNMKTAHCPTGHTELADETASNDHYPGDRYHSCNAVFSRDGEKYRVHVAESWGSDQGHMEEHGSREAIGREMSIRGAIDDARTRARDCGIETEYLEQVLCKAEDSAEEADKPAIDVW